MSRQSKFVRWVFFSMLFVAVSVGQDPVSASALTAPTQLAELIEEGLSNNQNLKSLAKKLEALKDEAAYAGSLNDPRIGIGLVNLPSDTFRFDQEPMTQKQLFIAQKIPWYGKLSLRSRRVVMKAKRLEALLTAKRLELTRKVAVRFYELGFVATSQKINDRLIKTIDQLLRVSETKYAVGKGLQQDVFQAQVELSKLLDEKIVLSKKRRKLEDQIHALLNREKFAHLSPPLDLTYTFLKLEVEDLKSGALNANPWLWVRRAEIDQAQVEIELSKKAYWPDMDFKLAYGQRDESQSGMDWADFVSASVIFNVPLWKKTRQDKDLAAKRAKHQADILAYQNLVDSLPHQVDALVHEIQTLQENYRLYSDALLLQAEKWAQSSSVAYEVGKLDFDTMIGAQLRLLRLENKADSYLFLIYQKQAELEEITGGPL